MLMVTSLGTADPWYVDLSQNISMWNLNIIFEKLVFFTNKQKLNN